MPFLPAVRPCAMYQELLTRGFQRAYGTGLHFLNSLILVLYLSHLDHNFFYFLYIPPTLSQSSLIAATSVKKENKACRALGF